MSELCPMCEMDQEHNCRWGLNCKEQKDLKSRIAAAEKELSIYRDNANKSRCSYCGEIGSDDMERVAKHMESCKKRPENVLLDHITELEAKIQKSESEAAAMREFIKKTIHVMDDQHDCNADSPELCDISEWYKDAKKITSSTAGQSILDQLESAKEALASIMDTDKTLEYGYTKNDRDRNNKMLWPPRGERWLTPREIAKQALGGKK